MLQIVRDRTPLTEKLIDEVNKHAREVASSLLDILSRSSPLYVTYAGASYAIAAARTFYWIVKQLTNTPIYMDSLDSFIYHVVAYRDEKPSLLAFVEPGGENIVGRLGELAGIFNVDAAVVTPPIPPPLKPRLESKLIAMEYSGRRPALFYVILAAVLGAEMVKRSGVSGRRSARLEDELSNIASTYDELVRRYKEPISAIAKKAKELATADKMRSTIEFYGTPTMLPAAIIFHSYTCEVAASNYGEISALFSKLAAGPLKSSMLVVLLATGVESDLIREAKFKLTATGKADFIEVIINTDPLSAPIYGTILAESFYDALH
ncbi:MAG: hypothetical protein ABWW70_01275 [Thermoproteota archaeon]